ncbi:MAG: hypothetical protein O7G85_03960, partial [Planctomycetota bacterium]|nr:hypothetical protein [Planctomycetota bacterium]
TAMRTQHQLRSPMKEEIYLSSSMAVALPSWIELKAIKSLSMNGSMNPKSIQQPLWSSMIRYLFHQTTDARCCV